MLIYWRVTAIKWYITTLLYRLMLMDLTDLPTQSLGHSDLNGDSSHHNVEIDSARHDDYQAHATESSNRRAVTLPANSILLTPALIDPDISWRIHNCKLSEKTVTQSLPMLFLYYYDSLDDSVKQAHPLTPALLAHFNTPMSAVEAAKVIGIDSSLLSTPWQVKVVGSLVVFSEVLQLAVRLHWTNTGKSTQQVYTKKADEALITAVKDWQFFGRIDVLYKNDKQKLISINEHAEDSEQLLMIDASTDYQYLPATHALEVIAQLEAHKSKLPWFETAILARLE